MRHFVLVSLTLAMVLSSLYVLKHPVASPAVDSRIGHPVASIGEVFRHY